MGYPAMLCWDNSPKGPIGGPGQAAEKKLSVPSVQLSDGGPVERYERLLERYAAEPSEVMGEVCARVVEGDSLRMVARDWGLPCARFMVWVTSDDERRAAYEGALRLRADELVHESLTDVGAERLGEHKLKVAGLWDRKRFGRGDGGGVGLRVVVQRFADGSGGQSNEQIDVTAEQGD